MTSEGKSEIFMAVIHALFMLVVAFIIANVTEQGWNGVGPLVAILFAIMRVGFTASLWWMARKSPKVTLKEIVDPSVHHCWRCRKYTPHTDDGECTVCHTK